MAFIGDHFWLPFIDEHPEWVSESRLVRIGNTEEFELLCSADAIAAFFNWASDRGILEYPNEAVRVLKSMRDDDKKREGSTER